MKPVHLRSASAFQIVARDWAGTLAKRVDFFSRLSLSALHAPSRGRRAGTHLAFCHPLRVLHRLLHKSIAVSL
jgi:hypothetical protein